MAEGAGTQEEQAQTDKNESEKFVFRAGILCRLQIKTALLRSKITQTQSGVFPLRQLQGRQRKLHDSFHTGCSLGNDCEGSGCGFGGFCALLRVGIPLYAEAEMRGVSEETAAGIEAFHGK